MQMMKHRLYHASGALAARVVRQKEAILSFRQSVPGLNETCFERLRMTTEDLSQSAQLVLELRAQAAQAPKPAIPESALKQFIVELMTKPSFDTDFPLVHQLRQHLAALYSFDTQTFTNALSSAYDDPRVRAAAVAALQQAGISTSSTPAARVPPPTRVDPQSPEVESKLRSLLADPCCDEDPDTLYKVYKEAKHTKGVSKFLLRQARARIDQLRFLFCD